MTIVIRAVSAALILFVSFSAQAHWWYSAKCCGERDCREATVGEVVLMSNGWYIATTEEIVPFDDERIQISMDDKFHVCTLTNPEQELKSRCLYIPEAQI
jgi:hypothetical protein